MHYYRIVDSRDAEWNDAVLDECSTLEVNDFLHDVNSYVTNQLLPSDRRAVIAASQGAPSIFVLPM